MIPLGDNLCNITSDIEICRVKYLTLSVRIELGVLPNWNKFLSVGNDGVIEERFGCEIFQNNIVRHHEI